MGRTKLKSPLNQHLDYMMRELRMADYTEERRVQFRPSSFPICPRMVALHELRKVMHDGVVCSSRKFVNDPYFAVGTVVHEVYQSWLGRIGALYGIWRCPAKRSLGKIEMDDGSIIERVERCNYSVEQWGTSYCPKCALRGRKTWLLYEEYNLQPEAEDLGLYSASADGAMYLGDGRHGYPIPPGSDYEPDAVLELKTTSDNDFKTRNEPKSKSHLEQASTYAELLRKLKGWDIKHIVYGYINRNHPWQVKFFRHDPLPPGTLDKNAWNFVLGRAFPEKISRLPAGLCSQKSDAEGFGWYGMNWMGCPDATTCFGGNGEGGINGGERTWVDSALERLYGIEEPTR